jgi:methylmalonyl-CoA mutase cobalamin-binding subunit
MKALVLGATIGDCAHAAGLLSFLNLAEAEGYATALLGLRQTPRQIAEAICRENPSLVAIGYRLTPEPLAELLAELHAILPREIRDRTQFVFGGTPSTARVAARSGLFVRTFSGTESTEKVLAFLRGTGAEPPEVKPAQTLAERIAQRAPYPLLRHHFGRPSVEETVQGAHEIAQAQVLDVLSIGPDQNAQEHFFQPQRMDPQQDGAGGVPLRREEDLAAIYQATRCGNYPLVRCYCGTRDLIRWAEMSLRTIHNAWAAIPLTWYSRLDARSDRPLPDAIAENLAAIRWHAQRGVPVEVNEAHQWSLRKAPDVVAVAAAFLAAYNAKRAGVRQYVAQFMFNTPAGTSPQMDLAKMLAKLELIGKLEGPGFCVFRQVRAGLSLLSPLANRAKGQMAASAVIALALRPHIFHVVGFSEADHAATAAEVIESCQIAQGAISTVLDGLPDMSADTLVQRRKAELVEQAQLLLEAIRQVAPEAEDPWADPLALTRAIESGLLDAPDLRGNPHARGQIVTAIVYGACQTVDGQTGRVLPEQERIAPLRLLEH